MSTVEAVMSSEHDDAADSTLQLSTHTMNDLRQYTKRFIVDFIELYKSHPTLWQIKNKDYRDKAKKAAAYEVLVKKCKEVEPDCDKDTVVKKINSLRTCYRKEFRKVQQSLARPGEEVYKPKLWYYDLLSFLNDDAMLAFNRFNDSFIYADEENTSDYSSMQCDPLTSHSESMSESARSSPTTSMFVHKSEVRKRKKDEPSDVLFVEQKAPSSSEDEFDLLGKIYAAKLRKLSRGQKIFAEKIINDTLFEAELGGLNRQCRLVIAPMSKKDSVHHEVDLKCEFPEDGCDEVDSADTSFVE